MDDPRPLFDLSDDDRAALELMTLPTRPNRPPWNLARHIPPHGVNLPYLVWSYSLASGTPQNDEKKRRALYMKIRRRCEALQEKGVLSISKSPENLVFVRLQNKALYLIKAQSFSKWPQKGLIDNRRSVYDFPKRARLERYYAIDETVKSQAWMTPETAEKVENEFLAYMDDVKNRYCLIMPKDDPKNPDKLTTIPYKTRFTSKKMQYENLAKMDEAWQKATERHQHAVFLTLTTDPKRFVSAWHANRHFQTAWNRYMQYITYKRGGRRPEYIAVFEFTRFKDKDGNPKNGGLLHAHVVFFGLEYLAYVDQISKDWARTKQGEVVHVYGLKNDGLGAGWTWKHKSPKDAKGKKPQDYLSKYLKKALFADTESDDLDQFQHAMYWVYNKRFFSYSRALVAPKIKIPASGKWFFLGSARAEEIPAAVVTWMDRAARMKDPPPAPAIIPATDPPVQCPRNTPGEAWPVARAPVRPGNPFIPAINLIR